MCAELAEVHLTVHERLHGSMRLIAVNRDVLHTIILVYPLGWPLATCATRSSTKGQETIC